MSDRAARFRSLIRIGASVMMGLVTVPVVAACGGESGEPGGNEASLGDTVVAADTYVGPDSVADTTGAAAAAPGASTSARADTAPAGQFFVRLVAGADPWEVAERHGVEPDTVYTERARAFVAVLTRGQVDALQRDRAVQSVAQRIEGDVRKPLEPEGLPIPE